MEVCILDFFSRHAQYIEAAKSADFIVVDRDILALAEGGNAEAIRDTKVIWTWLQERSVYVRGGDIASNSLSIE